MPSTTSHEVRRTGRDEVIVRAATPSDRSSILALVAEMIPGCDVGARWRWLYEGNPSGPAATWLAVTRSGEVAGCTSLFPFRLWLEGSPVLGSLGGDGYVRPAFRRRGLGAELHAASRRDMRARGFACMYGAPGELNVTPLKHGGSREVGTVSRWARPVRGRALGLRAAPIDAIVHAMLRPRGHAELTPMVVGDARVDALWSATAPTLRIAAVRDAAFYAWRFLAAPGRAATPYVIVERGQPIAACALEPLLDGRALRIVDLVARPEAWQAALGAISRHAADRPGTELVDLKLATHDGRVRRLWRAGFVEREQKPLLCMIPDGGDSRLHDPARWFYSGADSDVETAA
jgi:hypothetical protein